MISLLAFYFMNMVSLTYKLECPLLNTNMLIGKIYFKKKAYIT